MIHGEWTTIHFEDFDELVVGNQVHLEMKDKRHLWSKIGSQVTEATWTTKGVLKECGSYSEPEPK